MIATKIAKTVALAAATTALIAGTMMATSKAEARGGREYFVQTYTMDKPMHGFSGRQGNYMCDYQRLPNRVCKPDGRGGETCKIVSWTLRQHCY